MSDISENGRYYRVFPFVLSFEALYAEHGRKTASADTAHKSAASPQTYGATFVVTYDTNILPLLLPFACFIDAEFHEKWKTLFEDCKKIDFFDVPMRTTIVDQEKSTGNAYERF